MPHAFYAGSNKDLMQHLHPREHGVWSSDRNVEWVHQALHHSSAGRSLFGLKDIVRWSDNRCATVPWHIPGSSVKHSARFRIPSRVPTKHHPSFLTADTVIPPGYTHEGFPEPHREYYDR